MKVSRSMAYAIQALLQLAAADTKAPIPCNYLAREGQMPERFLLQILRTLVNNGVLSSIRGVEGGYVLAKPVNQITLLDIYEAFDTPIVPSIPPLPSLGDYARKKMADSMNRVASIVRRELSQTSIADLLQNQGSETNADGQVIVTHDGNAVQADAILPHTAIQAEQGLQSEV